MFEAINYLGNRYLIIPSRSTQRGHSFVGRRKRVRG